MHNITIKKTSRHYTALAGLLTSGKLADSLGLTTLLRQRLSIKRGWYSRIYPEELLLFFILGVLAGAGNMKALDDYKAGPDSLQTVQLAEASQNADDKHDIFPLYHPFRSGAGSGAAGSPQTALGVQGAIRANQPGNEPDRDESGRGTTPALLCGGNTGMPGRAPDSIRPRRRRRGTMAGLHKDMPGAPPEVTPTRCDPGKQRLFQR